MRQKPVIVKINHELQTMPESLQDFERVAASFSPLVLVGLGLAAVLAGLFLWVGGLSFRKILAAILGAVSGVICGFFIIKQNIAALALAAIAAIVAVILERFFITVLAVSLATAFALTILACPYIERSGAAIALNHNEVPEQGLTISASGSLKIIKIYTGDFIDKLKQACPKMPVYNWLIIAALVVIFMLAGLYLYRLASAFCCAALGTIFIFAGMILLLLYKTSAPISHICHRSSVYLAVFIAMITFGTVEQILICKSPKRQPRREKQTNKTRQASDEAISRWRTT